jgi:hypothetical protein
MVIGSQRALVTLNPGGELDFNLPGVHPEAKLTVTFHRTLRVPNDGATYPLPPSLGTFPLEHVDDWAPNLPKAWKNHGGVFLPMYQSEALWINFASLKTKFRDGSYPFAVQVLCGKINAITGEEYNPGLSRSPQNYLVTGKQPRLDGFCVRKGQVRQFVAAPLGVGHTIEEQIGSAKLSGGIQIIVYAMKEDEFEDRFPFDARRDPRLIESIESFARRKDFDMGIAAGGAIKQEIYKDPYDGDKVWNEEVVARCFVHLLNSEQWETTTGKQPPSNPFSAADYTRAGLPWFDYYRDDVEALSGSKMLRDLKSYPKDRSTKRKKFTGLVKRINPDT